jgi:uncharacterized membrane protein
MNVRDLHPQQGELEFRWRGGDPTRVEGLTDVVFGFALTLLVVSNAPPATFSELRDTLWGMPGFAAAFLMLLLLWHSHYIFFRRYGLADGWTTTLNAALLFIILFFIYPLKYLATMLSHFVRSVAEGAPAAPLTLTEARDALIMLSCAYAAVFATFLALYLHALSKANALALDPRELALTRFGAAQQAIHVTAALAVVAMAPLAPVHFAPFTGFFYTLIGPAIFAVGAVSLRTVRRAA